MITTDYQTLKLICARKEFSMTSDDIIRNFVTKVSVAQLVEQLTLNQRVQGSSPCGDTKWKRVTSFGV